MESRIPVHVLAILDQLMPTLLVGAGSWRRGDQSIWNAVRHSRRPVIEAWDTQPLRRGASRSGAGVRNGTRLDTQRSDFRRFTSRR